MPSPLFSFWERSLASNSISGRIQPKLSIGEGCVFETKGAPDPEIANHGNATLLEINHRLDGVGGAHELDEHLIEDLVGLAEGCTRQRGMVYWLTLARLLEAALLCAGHYADNCEFGAAGDLLVNPRKIRVRIDSAEKTFDKDRHGRLTDQLARRRSKRDTVSFSKRKVACETVVPALLPYLYRLLTLCGYFDRSYLRLIEQRMTAVADTLGFLAAGQIYSNEILYNRLENADPAEREFLQRHLCRFEETWFHRFGSHIHRIQSGVMSMADGSERFRPDTKSD